MRKWWPWLVLAVVVVVVLAVVAWPGGSQSQLHTVGIELDRVEERVTARPPTPEEAEALDLPPAASVLVLRKTSIDINDRVVEVSCVVLPGDRTEMLFTTPLERW